MLGLIKRHFGAGLACLAALVLVGAIATNVATAEEIRAMGLTVRKVDSIPTINGDGSDPQWANIPGIFNDHMTIRMVHDGTELAMLVELEAPHLTINSTGNWLLDEGRWVRWMDVLEGTEWTPRTGYGTEWFSIYWEMEDFGMAEGGCSYTCHTVGDGYSRESGHIFADEEGLGGKADIWATLAKHGYGPGNVHDQGWSPGGRAVYQGSPLTFDVTNPADPFAVTSGTVGFFGYAQEKVQTTLDDPTYMARDTETIEYCSQCHTEEWVRANALQGDDGRMAYRRNGLGAPEYIKPQPANWADAVVITEADIANGRAVRVAGLTEAELQSAWAEYQRLNALVPELILQEPEGSNSDIPVAAVWSDGKWTIELKRALVTGHDDDIQFDDLSKSYTMSVIGYSGGATEPWNVFNFNPDAVIVYFEQ